MEHSKGKRSSLKLKTSEIKKKTIKALEEKIEKTSPKLVQKYRCRKLERIDKKIEGLIQEA